MINKFFLYKFLLHVQSNLLISKSWIIPSKNYGLFIIIVNNIFTDNLNP